MSDNIKDYGTYLERNEISADGERFSFAIQTTIKDFGETRLKIQESGQDHRETEWRDINY